MPIYCYEDDRGKIHERFFSIMAQIPSAIILDNGKRAKRAYSAERKSIPSTKGWPMECFASGVHPSQAGELRDFLRSKGVATAVNEDGNPIYEDAGHRKKALKARNIVDKAAYC